MELSKIKGLGPKGIEKIERLKIFSVEDLLLHYPYRYEKLERTDISALKDQDHIVVDGIVETEPRSFYFQRKMNRMVFRFATEDRIFQVSIFNRSFLKPRLTVGTDLIVIGKYDQKRNTITASDLRFGRLPKVPTWTPVYHLTDGITEKQFAAYIDQAFQLQPELEDALPIEVIKKYQFPSKMSSMMALHHPTQKKEFQAALLRLKYEELFTYMLKLTLMKKEVKEQLGLKRTTHEKELQNFLTHLPFQLTVDQQKCVNQIHLDFCSPHRMNRLVQGDVGSGKTMVAFLSMYLNFLDGYQSAFMVPTEILANQHFEKLKSLFDPFSIHVEKLTGKMTAQEKKKIWCGLADGSIDVVVGTHALMSEGVTYQNLGLVITDEQHRFGVNQRGNLKNKGVNPDVLYMSATPIPRTYALTLYGDMDISSIHTAPSGRKKIITTLKKETEMKDVLESMYEQLRRHHQIYVIAPLIEESEQSMFHNVYELEENMKKAFGKIAQIGLLHGKMKAEEKEQVMQKFQDGEIQILISTTVIEVGVDVENATMIVIFDADRYGLATLHQLRGRVGRNDLQSYAILISNKESERLSILTRVSDGFDLSEADFKLRGSGDLFGERQSGDMNFRLVNLKQDFSIALRAKEDAMAYLETISDITKWKESVQYLD